MPSGTFPVGVDELAVAVGVGIVDGAAELTLGSGFDGVGVGVGWPVQAASRTPAVSHVAVARIDKGQAFFQTRIQSTDIDGRAFCFFTVDFFTPDPGRASGFLIR